MNRRIFCLAFCYFILQTAFGQVSINLELLKAPCNKDGILKATILGLNKDVKVNWNFDYNGTGIVINEAPQEFIINNFNGGTIRVTAYNREQYLTSFSATFPYPFDVKVNYINPACPKKGYIKAEVTGGNPPYQFEWYKYVENHQELNLLRKLSNSTTDSLDCYAGFYHFFISDSKGCKLDNYSLRIREIQVQDTTNIDYSVLPTLLKDQFVKYEVSNINGISSPNFISWANGQHSPSIIVPKVGVSYSFIIHEDTLGCRFLSNPFYKKGYKTFNTDFDVELKGLVDYSCKKYSYSIQSIISGGTPPYRYHWSNGATTSKIEGLSKDKYYLTVWDSLNNAAISKGGFDVLMDYSYFLGATKIEKLSFPSRCNKPTGEVHVRLEGKRPISIEWHTNPIQTDTFLKGVPAGRYHYTLTDAMGCKITDFVDIPPISIPKTTFNDRIFVKECNTDNKGSIMLGHPQSGIPPFQYRWSNGDTTSTIRNLTEEDYTVTISDAEGCTFSKSFVIPKYSPIKVLTSVQNSSCLLNSDGRIDLTVIGGKPPYQFNWSNKQTTQNIMNLETGYYTVTINDSGGCSSSEVIFVGNERKDSLCFCKIEGYVFEDLNKNCIKDANETGLKNVSVYCKGIGYTFTNQYGYYNFYVPSGTYQLSQSSSNKYIPLPCSSQNKTITVSAGNNCTSNVDFGNSILEVHDLQISTIPHAQLIPGKKFTQDIIITNKGTVIEKEVFAVSHFDKKMNPPFSIFPRGYDNNFNHTQSFDDVQVLEPEESLAFSFDYEIPDSLKIGQHIVFQDSCFLSPISKSLENDATPHNNYQFLDLQLSKQDSNYLTISPQNANGEFSLKDSILQIAIHFSNQRFYTWANHITIHCHLDKNMDINSVVPVYSKFPTKINLSENGIISYDIDFLDIGSDPYRKNYETIIFNVKLKKGTPHGATLETYADVYLDYDTKVTTKKVINTVNKPFIKDIAIDGIIKYVYPNPNSSESLYIELNQPISGNTDFEIFNSVGALCSKNSFQIFEGEQTIGLDISSLENGIYFLRVRNNNETSKGYRFLKIRK